VKLKNGILEFDVFPRGFVQAVFEQFKWEPIVERDLLGKPFYQVRQVSLIDGSQVKLHTVTRWDYRHLCDILESQAHPDIIP
jgi:hypothetical protein